MSRLRRSHGCPTLALSRFLHPTTFDSFHPRPSSKHISAVGAEQVSPARKGWVHDAEILRSAVGAAHSAFVRALCCPTRNNAIASKPRIRDPRRFSTPAQAGMPVLPKPMHIPESAHLWTLFVAGHGLHVLKRASLSAKSRLSGTKTRREWLRTNALALGIRLFVNAAAFSYWIAHPGAATHLFGSAGLPVNLTLEPGHATAAMFGLSGDSLMDWAAAKIPALQKEIPVVND